MLALAGVVFVLVMAVLYRALTHQCFRAEPRSSDDRGYTRWVIAGGIGLPAVLLTPLFLFSLHTLGGLAPPGERGVFEVLVTGRQWWWDVEYTGHEPARTANEIHIPVGTPVRVKLRSADVIHSFWVPALQGKLDLVPGRVNTTWIQADSPGVYRGECAEYCGLQHARMGLRVIAQEPGEFAAWLRRERQSAGTPTDSAERAGQAVFLASACPLCHTIRGTPAGGIMGPDLTHLASRSTLAAGTLPNTRGHLGGWIANPQAIKPGTQMPRLPLRSEELQALLAYLGTLE